MMAYLCSCEAAAFQCCFSLLQNGVQDELSEIAPRLFSKSLISSGNLDKALSRTDPPVERAAQLLKNLKSRVDVDPDSFHSILRELDSCPTLQKLVTCLESEFKRIKGERERDQRPPTQEVTALMKTKEHKVSEETNSVSGPRQTLSCEVQQKRSEEAVALVRTNELRMRDRFARLQTAIYEKIQERLDAKEIKIKNFHVYMTNLFPREECIPETTDVSEIFTAITNSGLWDYLNYEPLERVARMYGGDDPDLTAKLEKYTQDLVGYKLVTKMADYLSAVTSSSESGDDDDDNDESPPSSVRKDRRFCKKLTVKLNIPIKAQSLKYVDEIWNSLSMLFCLPSSSAVLDKIMEGSLYITWLIPAVFVPQVMEKAEQPKIIGFFREMKILLIEVDGACIFEEKEEQEGSSGDSFEEGQEPPPKPKGAVITAKLFQEESVELEQISNETSQNIAEESAEVDKQQDCLHEELTQHATGESKQKSCFDEFLHFQEKVLKGVKEERDELREIVAFNEVEIGQLRSEVTGLECLLSQTQEEARQQAEEIAQLKEQLLTVKSEPKAKLRVTAASIFSFKIGDIVTIERSDAEPYHGAINYLDDPFNTGHMIVGLDISETFLNYSALSHSRSELPPDAPTDVELEELTKEILTRLGEDWVKLQSYLNIPEDVMVADVLTAEKGVRRQLMKMLKIWRDQEECTRESLAKSLTSCDLRLKRVADKLVSLQYSPNSATSSPSDRGRQIAVQVPRKFYASYV